MKLKFKVIIPLVIIISTGFIIYFGFFLLPNLTRRQQDTKIIYIAPYITYTHTCHTHSSGCTGELPNQLINYTVSTNGEISTISDEIITESNGFFQLELETNTNYTIQMQTLINETLYWGSTEFSTSSGSANCITIGQLKLYS